jgi:hypothetical protein
MAFHCTGDTTGVFGQTDIRVRVAECIRSANRPGLAKDTGSLAKLFVWSWY